MEREQVLTPASRTRINARVCGRLGSQHRPSGRVSEVHVFQLSIHQPLIFGEFMANFFVIAVVEDDIFAKVVLVRDRNCELLVQVKRRMPRPDVVEVPLRCPKKFALTAPDARHPATVLNNHEITFLKRNGGSSALHKPLQISYACKWLCGRQSVGNCKSKSLSCFGLRTTISYCSPIEQRTATLFSSLFCRDRRTA